MNVIQLTPEELAALIGLAVSQAMGGAGSRPHAVVDTRSPAARRAAAYRRRVKAAEAEAEAEWAAMDFDTDETDSETADDEQDISKDHTAACDVTERDADVTERDADVTKRDAGLVERDATGVTKHDAGVTDPLPLPSSRPLSPQTPLSPTHLPSPTPVENARTHEAAEASASSPETRGGSRPNSKLVIASKARAQGGHRRRLPGGRPRRPHGRKHGRPAAKARTRGKDKPAAFADGQPAIAQAMRLAGIFHRAASTPWTGGEILAFRRAGPLADEDVQLLEGYYAAHYPPDPAGNRLRHDLVTLLQNIRGEVDRARRWEQRRRPPEAGSGGRSFFSGTAGWTQQPERAPWEAA